jgi:hypothetical protein
MEENMPVYVKVERPREVFDVITVIKSKIQDSRVIFNKVMDLMEKEEEELSNWNSKIQAAKARFDYLNKVLRHV